MQTFLKIGVTTTDPAEQARAEWLGSKVTADTAQEYLSAFPYRFEKLKAEWLRLRQMIDDETILRLFSAPSGANLYSRTEGYALLRGGEVVATLALPERTPLDAITSRHNQADPRWLNDRIADSDLGRQKLEGLSDQWEAMRQIMLEGDEVWEFCSDFDSWANLCGRAGFALVRRGKVIATIVTMLN